MLKAFLLFLYATIKTIGLIILWFVLAGVISHGISELNTERYQLNDTPNDGFMIIGTDTDNGYYRQTWQEYQTNPKLPLTIPDKDCIEDCLKQLDNGNYLFINESAMYMSHSEYQIKGNKIIPISFKTYHLGHIFVGMIGAFFVMGFLKYLFSIFQIRKNKQAMMIYHKKLAKNLLITCAVLGIFWTVIYLTV
ncbi:Uncharacterised protein [Moraxella lacunata]|uniref:Uncharacterized protein n=1 Tax=Moraxella lacunata TaxID=477 RepID=A0A1V4GTX8_MORLA|nr:hypothetical protein [Moraxella lacunata]OPH36082.1 hypothetical protein B5J94_08000 [Moraxella lacunata]STY99457.1 Uncharacterised protein [Moraxella lacunata]